MTAILIPIASKKQIEQYKQIAATQGERPIFLDDDDLEDFLFGLFMKKSETGKTVSRDTIMKKLKKGRG